MTKTKRQKKISDSTFNYITFLNRFLKSQKLNKKDKSKMKTEKELFEINFEKLHLYYFPAEKLSTNRETV